MRSEPRHPVARREPSRLAAVFAAGFALGILAFVCSNAYAHSARIGIAAKKILLKLPGSGAAASKFVFVGSGPAINPSPSEHPGLVGAALLVYGRDGAMGRSAFVELDRQRWSVVKRGGALRYVYSDKQGTRGGVRKVVLKPNRLVVKGGGTAFAWSGAGGVGELGVLFRVGEEWYCAGAAISGGGGGTYVARNVTAPAACPDAVCGNATHEIGEDCDDGNLDDGDSCAMSCARGSCSAAPLTGTWEAIQSVFQRSGCTQAVCHGKADGEGGLDLRSAVAYQNLFEVPSTGSALARVVPGGPRRSSLYLKLAKARGVAGVEISGNGMPSGLPPLDEAAVEAIRLWINTGAPETGTVEGTERLLDGCLPEPEPITITPLEKPVAGAGMQFEMPPFVLAADSETEVCFASYFDVSAVVPERFKDATGEFFYANGEEMRQDPQSHHLQLIYPGVPESRIHDPSYGVWSCKGGVRDGQACEPLDPGSCGADGLCGSEPRKSIACFGYGPPEYQLGILTNTIGGAQTAQFYSPGRPGFFQRVPMKGIVYWNSHAFNLTNRPHLMHARLNKYFTDDLRYVQYGIFDFGPIYSATGTPPFTERTVCATSVLPRGAGLLWLSSHTHKRGKRFWVDHPDGTRIHDNFSYDDPTTTNFDPPLRFLAADPAQRTLRYCGLYNNGVKPDGSPDPDTVRRRSTTPENASPCLPVACVSGHVGAPCGGVGDDRVCDSTAGANDGFCDACAITSGVSTEDEMFLLFGSYIFGEITD